MPVADLIKRPIKKLVSWALAEKAQEQGARRPRFFQVPSYGTAIGASWQDDVAEQVKHYKHWVFKAVNTIAFKVAATPLNLFRKDRERDEEKIDEHPFLALINDVNPIHTSFYLWSTTMTFLEITGNAYWWIVRNRLGLPQEIWNLPSQYMRVIPDATNLIRGYQYQNADVKIELGLQDVIHLKYPNPASLYYGRGPLQAAAESTEAHESARTAQWKAFKHGIFPATQFTYGETMQDVLDDETIDRLQVHLQQFYGGEEKAGKVFIADGGGKLEPVTLTPREMDFLNSTKATREEILGIFGVPAAIAGLAEDVNRASATALELIFSKYTIKPKLQLMQDQLNQDLLPAWGDGVYCRYEEVVPQDREAARADAEMGLRNGALTINEVRTDYFDRDEVEWGDVAMAPMSQIPISGEGAERPAPATEEETAKLLLATPAIMTKRLRVDASLRRRVHRLTRRLIDPIEARLTKKMAARFKAEAKVVGAALRAELTKGGAPITISKDAADDVAKRVLGRVDWTGQADAMYRAARGALGEALVKGAIIEAALLNVKPNFDVSNPAVATYLKGKGTTYWKNFVQPDTIKKIHNTIAEGVRAGEGIRELSARVSGTYGEFQNYRAVRIARTETLGAHNHGGSTIRKREGIQKKVWISTIDDLTRADHVDMDGETRKNAEEFSNGLQYPGDSGGDPAEIVNCRCTSAGVPEGEED